MTPRQLYRETLLFGTPDKVPFNPGDPREKTLARWHQEGLSEGIGWYDYLLEVLVNDWGRHRTAGAYSRHTNWGCLAQHKDPGHYP